MPRVLLTEAEKEAARQKIVQLQASQMLAQFWWLLPLAFLKPLMTSLTLGGSLELGVFQEVVTNRTFQSIAWFTLWQAVVSTVLTLLAALPAAYVFARYDFPGKRLLEGLIMTPFAIPGTLTSAALALKMWNPGLACTFGSKK